MGVAIIAAMLCLGELLHPHPAPARIGPPQAARDQDGGAPAPGRTPFGKAGTAPLPEVAASGATRDLPPAAPGAPPHPAPSGWPSSDPASSGPASSGPAPSAPLSGRLAAIQARRALRVCHATDYFGISWRNPRNGELEGMDIEMARLFASLLLVRLELVEAGFPGFQQQLRADACDIAMMGVSVTPERARQVAFSTPYLSSPIYAVTTGTSPRIHAWQDLDRPGMVVAVLAGTFMSEVMPPALKHAELAVLRQPRDWEQELLAGRIDAFMCDYPYSRRVLMANDWARVIDPPDRFGEASYAYAVPPGEPGWLDEVNALLAMARADGRLAAAAARHGLSAILLR
jgi:ABC-type amino acid transport substrate-binding protein